MVGGDSYWSKVLQVPAGQLVRVGKSKAGTWYKVLVDDKVVWEIFRRCFARIVLPEHVAPLRYEIVFASD